jgi:hypothetical protein
MIDQTTYRSLVGKIMYAVGKISPSIAYATHELASHMQNPSEAHWKAMQKIVGYMKSKNYPDLLILRRPKELRVVSGSDASHASASPDRKSTMGEIHTLGGTYIYSGSRKVRCITLSSTESEIHALSTAGQQVKFMNMLLDECMLHKNEERKTAWLYNDNIGGLFLTNNKQVGMRTKHIDIRALFIRELQEEGTLKVLYEKSELLTPDILSKNLAQEHFTRHMRNIQYGNLISWREDVGDDRARRLGFVQNIQVSAYCETKQQNSIAGARRPTASRANRVESSNNKVWDKSSKTANKLRKYSKGDSHMINRDRITVGQKKKDAREVERPKRQSNPIKNARNRRKSKYSTKRVIPEYLADWKKKNQ